MIPNTVLVHLTLLVPELAIRSLFQLSGDGRARDLAECYIPIIRAFARTLEEHMRLLVSSFCQAERVSLVGIELLTLASRVG
jgi:hypothetical protein